MDPPGGDVVLVKVTRKPPEVVKAVQPLPPSPGCGTMPRSAQSVEAAHGKVAAVVPCHNYGRFLGQCLKSLEAQTRPFDEVLIVDDNSSDDTPDIADAFVARHRNWRYLRVKLGMGPLSRNAGVAETQADFIVHVDADNWLYARFVETLIPAFTDHRVGLAYGRLRMVGEDGAPSFASGFARPFDHDSLRRANYIDTCAISRRQCHEDAGGWKPHQYLDDWIFALDITRAGWDCRYVDETVAAYRQHPTQTTRTHDYTESRQRAMREAFEVAVVTPFAGRTWALKRYFEALDKLDWPRERLRVVAIDNSGDAKFGRELRKRLSGVRASSVAYVDLPTEHAMGLSAAELAANTQVRTSVADATSVPLAALWQRAGAYLGTADVVLTWEDDVVPPDGALTKLFEGLGENVGVVAGIVRMRYGDKEPLLQRFTSLSPVRREILPQPGPDEIAPVDFTGFGFSLIRRQLWREIRFRVRPDWAVYTHDPWYDVAFAKDAKILGWDWMAHGGVVVRHYQEGGREYV